MRPYRPTALLLLALLQPALAAASGSFTFTRIADNGGALSTFLAAGINDGGTVAMTATLRAGGYAVLAGDGRRVVTVATIAGHNSSFSRAAIDRRGEVFFQSTAHGMEALLRGFQGRVSTVVDSSGPFDLLAGGPLVDARGTLTFFGTLRGAAGVYALGGGPGGQLTKIVEDPRLTVTYSPPFDVNERGQAVFAANPDDPRATTLLVSDGRRARIVADGSGTIALFTSAAIDDGGRVAFTALRKDGTQAMYLAGPQGGAQSVVTVDAPYHDLHVAGLSNAGVLVWSGSLDSGESGVFAGLDPAADRVLGLGDELDGRTVAEAAATAVNAGGQIAVIVLFDDGTRAIYRAQPARRR